MASAADFPTAFAKAERAAGRPLPTRRRGVPLGPRRRQGGGRRGRGRARRPRLRLFATAGTADALAAAGMEVEGVRKVAEEARARSST